MGDIVNLRQIRKRKAGAEKEAAAEENRARFGRTRADKEHARMLGQKAERDLDGHKLDGGPKRRP